MQESSKKFLRFCVKTAGVVVFMGAPVIVYFVFMLLGGIAAVISIPILAYCSLKGPAWISEKLDSNQDRVG
jgi:hypothetical protein